jgi:hypothetical protein
MSGVHAVLSICSAGVVGAGVGVQVWWAEDGRNAMETTATQDTAGKACLLWPIGMVLTPVNWIEVKRCRDPKSITVCTPYRTYPCCISTGLVVVKVQ